MYRIELFTRRFKDGSTVNKYAQFGNSESHLPGLGLFDAFLLRGVIFENATNYGLRIQHGVAIQVRVCNHVKGSLSISKKYVVEKIYWLHLWLWGFHLNFHPGSHFGSHTPLRGYCANQSIRLLLPPPLALSAN